MEAIPKLTSVITEQAGYPNDANQPKKKLRSLLLVSLVLFGFVGAFLPLIEVRAAGVVINTGQYATMGWYSYQRRLFFAQSRYWSFHANGTDYLIRSSTDGVTWGDEIVLADQTTAEDGYHVDVHFDGTYFHYAYSYCTLGDNITYRKGAPQSNGSISWEAVQQEAFQDNNVMPKYPTVAIDSDGDPYIAFAYYDNTTGNWHPYITKSSTNDGTWSTDSGYPLQLAGAGNIPFVRIHGLASLGWMYVLYGRGGDLDGRMLAHYDGSLTWGSEESILAGTIAGGEQYSSLVIGNSIYVCFLQYLWADPNPYQVSYIKRSSGSGWGSVSRIADATSQSRPSISITNMTQEDFVCFWGSSDTVYYSNYTTSWQSAQSWFTDSDMYGDESIQSSVLPDGNGGIMFTHVNGSIFNANLIYRNWGYEYEPEPLETLPPGIVDTINYSNTAYYTFQHRMFYSDARYWILYTNSTDYLIRSSLNGSTWGDTIVLKDYTGNETGPQLDLWFDGTYLHYAYTRSTENASLLYRRGDPQSDGSITWSAVEQTVFQENFVRPMFPSITIDENSYPFISYYHNSTTNGTDRYPYVSRSSTNDGTWTTASNYPLQLSSYSGTSYTCILRLPNYPYRMYGLYTNGTNLYGKLYARFNGGYSWGSEESVFSDLVAGSAFSAVSVENDIHVAITNYIPTDPNPYNLVHKERTTQGWGSETYVDSEVNSGTRPSLAVTNSTAENIAVFWAEDPYFYYANYTSGLLGDLPEWGSSTEWFSDTDLYEDEAVHTSRSIMNSRVMFFYVNGTEDNANLVYRHWGYEYEHPPSPSIDQDYSNITLSADTILRTNQSDFVIGNDLELRGATIYDTSVWLNVSTNFDFQMWTQTTGVNLTITDWFDDNNNANLTITSPLSTNITFGLYSPDIDSASATGIVSQSWNSANNTLTLILNSDTSSYFVISLVATPSNREITITNMEADSWVYAETKYYQFQAVYTGYTSLDQVWIRFSDTWHYIYAYHDLSEDVWGLTQNCTDYAQIRGGTTISSGNMFTATFHIWLKNTILDAYDVDLWMYSNNTDGTEDGWEIIQADYFNIYSLGGKTNYTFTGSGARTVGGDFLEIGAGGSYPADIFEDQFIDANLTGWIIYNPNATSINLYSLQYVSFPYSMRLQDTWDNYAYATHYFTEQTGNFSVQFEFRTPDNSKYAALRVDSSTFYDGVDIGISDSLADAGRVQWFNVTANAYQNCTTNSQVVSDTWYNFTFEIDVVNGIYDIYLDDTLIQEEAQFSGSTIPNNLSQLHFSSYARGVPASEDADFLIDNVKVWRDDAGGYGGSAEVTIDFEKLQNIHTQFAIGIPEGEPILGRDQDEGYVEWAISYHIINGSWVYDAWKVRINVTDARLQGYNWQNFVGYPPANWVQLNISWYKRDTYVRSDILYTFWEGGVGGLGYATDRNADYFRVWLDLWFNKVNGSRIGGGRLNSYYYGTEDRANQWLKWWTGSNWGPMMEDTSQSMFFESLEDNDGNIISSRQIDLMRVTARVWRSENYDYRWVLRDFDTVNFKLAEGAMQGIDTPVFVETKMPNMPHGGLLHALAVALNDMYNQLIHAITYGALNFWTNLVYFLDTIGSWLGFPNLFSNFLSYVTSFYNWMVNAFTYLISLLTSAFLFFTATMTKFTSAVSTVITYWILMFNTFIDFLDGTYTAGIRVWDDLGGIYWLTLGAILYPLYLVFLWDEKGGDAVIGQVTFLMNVASFILTLFISVAQLFIGFVSFIIESIPVVE